MWGFIGVAAALAIGQTAPSAEEAGSVRVLTLEDAVKLALVENLNLQSSVDVVQGAAIGENLAESRFNFKLTPSYERGFGESSLLDQGVGLEVSKLLPFGTTVTGSMRSDWASPELGNVNASAVSLRVTQPLLRGFGKSTTEFDLLNSRRNLQSSERSLELARQRLAVDVVANYYNIVRQAALVDVAEKSLARNKELLRASEARLEVGLASKLDVFRAELQLSQAEDALIYRKEALELALDSFKFNLGLAPSDRVALEMLEPDYQPVEVDIETLTRTALQSRIEMREESDRIQDAQRALAVNRQNLLPQVDMNWRYERRGLGNSFGSSFDFVDNAFNMFLSTSYPLDRSSENASFAMSQIDLSARRRQMRLVEYNITNEVRAAARNLERLGKSIVLQERNTDFAEKQMRLATLRYQRGLASNFDIIDAENNLIQARSNYVSLLSDYHVAQIDLKRVTGTLDVATEFVPGNSLPSSRHHP
jgi:outer membrane protein TolC